MKRILLLLIIVLASSCATHTSFNSFYKSHQEDSDFSFGLSSSLIASFLPDEDMEEIKPLLKKAKHIRILVFSENAEEKTEKFQKFISRSKFEKVVKLKDDNDQIAFFTLEKKSNINQEREKFGNGIQGDSTGRNQSFDAFNLVQSYFSDAYLDLNNPEDQEMFKKWGLYNIKLLLDKYEEELSATPEAPNIENPT